MIYNIALIGPAGVGKGTHAAHLIEKFDSLHLVTGDLLRENLQQRRAVGFLAERYVTKGELVPDEVVGAMVAEWLWGAPKDKGMIFDGFPRTVDQAQFLDDIFTQIDRELDMVIYLKLSDEAVQQRLAGRIICDNCQAPFHIEFNPPAQPGVCDVCQGTLAARPYDIKEMVRVRLRAFNRALRPVLEYYQDSNRLKVVDGSQSLEQVRQAIFKCVEDSTNGRQQSTVQESLRSDSSREQVEMLSTAEATHKSFDIVLVGGPGSGKGTQAEQLKSHLDLPHIATGDLFRDNLKKETSLGKLAKSFMDKGALVPDDVTEAMVEDRMAQSDAAIGFILDGFPRTLPQTYALTDIMNSAKRRVSGVIYIRVSDEEIVRRLSGRLICRECQTPYHIDFKPPTTAGVCDSCGGELYQRDDDNQKTVRARLKTFHSQTRPIVEYYRDAGVLIEINGEGDVADVTSRSKAAVDALRAGVSS